MKTIQVENAKTRFFESKEDYLKFRQAWKDFHNEGKVVWYEDKEGKHILGTFRNKKAADKYKSEEEDEVLVRCFFIMECT